MVDHTAVEHDSYDPHYFEPLYQIEERHFWFRSRNKVIGELVKQLVSEYDSNYAVLEVGCGTGYVLQELNAICQHGSVIGTDLFVEGLEYARRRSDALLVQSDLNQSPFGIRFDLIGLFDVIEHIPDDIAVLETLHNMLSDDQRSRLFITVPAHPTLWSYFDVASHHCRRYTVEELQGKLQDSGYEVEYISEYQMCIYPLVWLGRRLSAFFSQFSKDYDSSEKSDRLAKNELKILPLVNELLAIVLGFEAILIRKRLKLPVGTSLLAIARKSM